jgi:hypothetical protein
MTVSTWSRAYRQCIEEADPALKGFGVAGQRRVLDEESDESSAVVGTVPSARFLKTQASFRAASSPWLVLNIELFPGWFNVPD